MRVSAGVVTRFAPSPTGRLHLGHAYSALLNEARAREAGGRFLLRIEDIDHTRCKPEHEAGIFEDLSWLGLRWDEPVWRQSDRADAYDAALERLRAEDLLYRCFRTRRELALSAPHGPEAASAPGPHAPDEERAMLAEGRPFAWRLWLDAARARLGARFDALTYALEGTGAVPADAARYGDVVLGRKDIGTSYHLAACVDDAASGVTLVLRGQDLADAAGLHALLHTLLGQPVPTFAHHALVTGPDGRRLAKRDRSVTLAAMREGGATPGDVRARLPF